MVSAPSAGGFMVQGMRTLWYSQGETMRSFNLVTTGLSQRHEARHGGILMEYWPNCTFNSSQNNGSPFQTLQRTVLRGISRDARPELAMLHSGRAEPP